MVTEVAAQAVAAGAPKAEAWQRLLRDAIQPEPAHMMSIDVVIRGSLDDWRATPVHVINGALEMAIESGDAEAIREVVWFGVDMLARWDNFLLAYDLHPERKREEF